MKISKKDLKQIVKECLVEILSEGLGDISQQPSSRVSESRYLPPGNFVPQSRQVTESAQMNRPKSGLPTSAVQSAVRELSAIRPDLASIFEDTARNTLQNQSNAERGMDMAALRGDMAAKVVSQATPDQLFGEESMNKWAELAFMPSSKKI